MLLLSSATRILATEGPPQDYGLTPKRKDSTVLKHSWWDASTQTGRCVSEGEYLVFKGVTLATRTGAAHARRSLSYPVAQVRLAGLKIFRQPDLGITREELF